MKFHTFGKQKHASSHGDSLLRQTDNFLDEEKYIKRLTLPQKLFFTLSSTKKPLFIFSIALILLTGSSFAFSAHNKSTQFIKQTSQAVLGAQTIPFDLQGSIVFSIPAQFNEDITANKGLTVEGDTTLNGNLIIKGKSLDLGNGTLTASNVLYGIKAGTGLSLTAGQNPTITNAGVTSFQGQTGSVALTAGSGISISGTTISNTQSSPNTFATISDGTNSFSAGSTNDTLTFNAGTGISLSLDTTNKKITIANSGSGGGSGVDFTGGVTGTLGVANGGTGLSSYSIGDLLYASGTTTIAGLAIGGSNTVLTSNGTTPAWSNSLTLSGLTVNGNLTLGQNSSNTITPHGEFAASIIPSSADSYDLGASSLEFNNLYVKNITLAGNLLAPSSGGTSGYWQLASGVLAPANITNDLLVGGNSTASAKFQVSGTTGNISASGTLTGLIGLTSSGTVDFTGLSTGILHSTSGVLSSAAVDLGTTDITGILAVGHGGTGANTFTSNGILYGNGTGAIQATGQGPNGDVLTANSSGVPVWSTLSVSGGTGGNCSNCLVNNPTTNQTINPSGNITGLSVAQTSTSSPTADIFDVTNSAGTTKYMQVDANGNLSIGGQVSFTNSSSTQIGTNITNNWMLNGNMLNNRRSITVTNNDPSNTLPADYEVTLNLTGATATDVCNNTRTDSNDLRISYGTSTEIARNVTRNCTTSITITFLLQANIAVGASDTYYIYYNNPNLSSSAPTYNSSTQLIDNADAVGNFTTTDNTYTPISQDTSTKQEGTGSVKIAITGGIPGVTYPSSTGADGTLDLSLGSGAGGCTGTGLSWNAGTSTCTITVATKSTYNFTTINIPSGTTLTMSTGTVTGTTPIVELLATGTVSIAGTVNLNNLGYAGGGNCGSCSGSGPGGGGSGGQGGAGGAGYGGTGTSGYTGTTAGTTYTGLNYGSGGGGAQFTSNGNNGGGAIQITTAGNMTVGGTLTANGTNAGCLGGSCTGGGSGGGIELQANNLTISGTINANGAGGGVYDGSHWGGSGGGGRIWLDYLNTVTTTGSTITANGGNAGSQTAGSGVILTQHAATSYQQSIFTTKSAMDLSTYGAICFYVRTDTLTGQYLQFGFGKSAITENLSNITISTPNSWQEVCANIGNLSVSARQGLTVFGFYVNNAPASNGNFWFDDIFAQTTGGFTGSAPTVGTGATILGTNNLTFNAQGLGSINLNYDPTNALAGTGGLNIFNGGSTNIFSIDGSGNASASGNLTLAGTSPKLKVLNGQTFTIQTSPGGDANLATKFTLLNNGFLGLGTTNPGSLFDVMGGQVGIGTTSPLATLDLRGNLGTSPIASFSGTTSFAGLVVDNKGAGDLFTASSSGLTRFVVSQNGYVGIGTTIPLAPLYVVQTQSNSGSEYTDVNTGSYIYNSTAGGYATLKLLGAASGGVDNQAIVFGGNSNSDLLKIEPRFTTTAGTGINILGNGNVGIGTTAPNALLSLGTAVQTNKLYLYDNTNDKYGFGIATNTLQIYSGAGAGSNNTIAFGKYDGITFTEYMREMNGSLGIGTTTPLLQSGIDIEKNALGNAVAVFNQSGSGDILTASSSGQTRFTIASNGNITINGSTTQTGNQNITGNQVVTGNLTLSGYATVSASLSIGSFSAPAGVGNALFSGSVGIGTSIPTQTLSIAGNESIYNTTTGRGDIYTTANLDKVWNTTALFNSAGTSFSAGMQNPATNNRLSLKPSSLALTGWLYRKAVTVNNTANTNILTNYQVKITADTASLISAGKMNSDCSDVRITDSDGTTLLNYWIESGCNTSSTIIWAKIPSITASTNYTIYLYYGNPGATTLSSAANTFIRKISNLQLAYTMDEASGNVNDTSGNGDTGTVTGTTSVAGEYGNARSLNGSSDIINAGNGTNVNPTGDFSFDFWIKPGSSQQQYADIISKHSSGNKGWNLEQDGTTTNNYYFSWGNGSSFTCGGRNDLVLTANTWQHVAVVYTSATTTVTFYINGTQTGSCTGGFAIQNSTDSLNLAHWSSGGGRYWNGVLDEFHMYNKALSTAEITSLSSTSDYAYTTTNEANTVNVRNYSSPEPSTSLGSETSSFTSGLQSWTSDTIDAGSGNTYLPNSFTVNYTLDGSDNIAPKFQIEGSNTGNFSGEQTLYPATGAYYQSGTAYPISSGVQLDISPQITARFRYWKVIAYIDTGATLSDTPTVSSIELQDNKAALSMLASGFVGMGTTNPLAKLDVSDAQSSTVSAFIRNINTGVNASGLAIQLGNTNPGTGNYFLSFLDGAGDIIGKIQGNGAGGISYATSGIDFAEYYKKASSAAQLVPGTIACETPSGANSCTTNASILGVVSNKAGFVGGTEHADDLSYVLVGMVGQLPVQISTASGTIQQGDPLTVGPDGLAIKATTAGQIIGHALQNSSEAKDETIMAAVNVSWYDPGFYSATLSQMPSASTAAVLSGDLPLITAQNATITDNLTVLGKTTVSDLGITGNISDGLISIQGLDGSLETLAGDLNLQSDRLGGINILNGLVTIDTTGNITTKGIVQAQSVEASIFVVEGNSSIGSASIPQGQTQVEIDVPVMSANDKVFLTPTVLTTAPLIVTDKSNGKFVVQIATAQKDAVSFDWFIVKNK